MNKLLLKRTLLVLLFYLSINQVFAQSVNTTERIDDGLGKSPPGVCAIVKGFDGNLINSSLQFEPTVQNNCQMILKKGQLSKTTN